MARGWIVRGQRGIKAVPVKKKKMTAVRRAGLTERELATLTAEEKLKFQHLPLREFILLRNDTYIGSIECDTFENTPVWDVLTQRVVFQTVKYSPGVIQLFEECIDNVTDNRLRGVGTDKAWISWDQFTWTLRNNGGGLPVVKHDVLTHLYTPEMVFSELQSSSNYADESREGGVSGRNGVGIKLANIYSTSFVVDVVDTIRQVHYHQEWLNNMSSTKGPVVTPINTHKKTWSMPYVQVRVTPDWKRLGMPAGMQSPGLSGMFTRRCIEAAVTTATATPVRFEINGWKVPAKLCSFRRYASSFVLEDGSNALSLPQPPALEKPPATSSSSSSSSQKQQQQQATVVKTETNVKEEEKVVLPEDDFQVSDGSDDEEMKEQPAVKKEEKAGGKEPAAAKATTLRDCLYESPNNKWEICLRVCQPSFNGPRSVCFVNCIPTSGTPVKHVGDQVKAAIVQSLAGKLRVAGAAAANKKAKKESAAAEAPAAKKQKKAAGPSKRAIKKQQVEMGISDKDIQNYLVLFVSAHLQKPAFDNQRKTTMTTPEAKFDPPCVLTPEFLKKLTVKGGVVDELVKVHKENMDLKMLQPLNSNKTRQGRVAGLSKLEDANWAGTKRSLECTLVLTEGASASTLVMAGFSVVGKDAWGFLSLKGVPKSARLAFPKDRAKNRQAMIANPEWYNIMRAVGLEFNCTYDESTEEGRQQMKKLRYGDVMLMGDNDLDGRKICGSLHSNFTFYWPEWTKRHVTDMCTPAYKLTHKKTGQVLDFDSDRAFKEYLETVAGGHDALLRDWTMKHYKGLGTSTAAEAMQYFSELDRRRRKLLFTDEKRDLADMEMIYGPNAAGRRKWLDDPVPEFVQHDKLEPGLLPMSHMNHHDQRDAAEAQNARHLATLLDGLSQSQRKIMHYMLQKNMSKEQEVEPLAGEVKSHTDYPHGVTSLFDTIVTLSQDFVGANNIPLLTGVGGIGTRSKGGQDHAAARYISVHLQPYAKKLFRDEDRPILPRWRFTTYDEPCVLAPILPLVLINGTEGIGVGRSTMVTSHRPSDIIRWLRTKLEGKEEKTATSSLVPWFRGHRGKVVQKAPKHFVSYGQWRNEPGTSTIEVTELPVHKWHSKFKECLDKLETTTKEIERYTQSGQVLGNIEFMSYKIPVTEAKWAALKAQGDGFEVAVNDWLGLSTDIQTPKQEASLWSFAASAEDERGAQLRVFTTEAILQEYYDVRLALYEKRKQHQIREQDAHCHWLRLQVAFMSHVLEPHNESRLIIQHRDETDVHVEVRARLTTNKEQKSGGELVAGAAVFVTVTDEEVDKLLKLALVQQTTQHQNKLERQLAEAEAALAELRARTTQSMWLAELAQLEPLLPSEELATTMPGLLDKPKGAAATGVKKKRGPNKPKAAAVKAGSSTAEAPKPKLAAPRKRKKKESRTGSVL